MHKIDYKAITEKLNLLKADEALIRTAASVWVKNRLDKELDAELAALGLTEEVQKAFLEGKEPGCSAVKQILLPPPLSQEAQKEETEKKQKAALETFLKNLKDTAAKQIDAAVLNRIRNHLLAEKKVVFPDAAALDAAAAENIMQRLLLSREERTALSKNLKKSNYKTALIRLQDYWRKKKHTAFQQEAGIDAATWSRFLRAEVMPEKNTLDKIIAGLGLTEEETKDFLSKVIQSEFRINDALKNDLKEKLKPNFSRKDSKGEYIIYETAKFIDHARLTQKAWRPFGITDKMEKAEKQKNPDAPEKNTSQDTLLKIVIGLKMDTPAGSTFLGHVNSGFFLYRDLVVRSCIECGIYENGKDYIDDFIEVLEHFAKDEKRRKPLYPDLYGVYK